MMKAFIINRFIHQKITDFDIKVKDLNIPPDHLAPKSGLPRQGITNFFIFNDENCPF